VQKNILLEFLNFLLDKKINLTIDEKTMLKNIIEDDNYLTLDDLKKWYYSSIRKNKKITHVLKSGVETEVFRNLIELDENELNHLIKSDNLTDIYFSLTGYAMLKRYSNNQNEHDKVIINNYNIKIINTLLETDDNIQLKLIKIRLISKFLFMYEDFSYIEKLANLNKVSIYNIKETIRLMDYYKSNNSEELALKYANLLIKSPNELFEYIHLGKQGIQKLIQRRRGMDAILKQDSYKTVLNLMIATLNDGVYHNKMAFDLITNETDSNKQKNLINLARYNRFKHDFDLFLEFLNMDYNTQIAFLNSINIKEEVKPISQEDLLDQEIDAFFKERSNLLKTKVLRNNLNDFLNSKRSKLF